MASSPDESSSRRIRPEVEVFPLRSCDEVGSERAMALGVFDEERTVTVCTVLLVWVVVWYHVFEASCVQGLGNRVEALLQVELSVFRGYGGL